ncbi:hypothetical protein LIER_07240 [Lithospermum erythrorhizon]|uniref:Pentatricopeptide repeat-containing protein n=1 Tax=Lithospermum erythrorhizon TaxID=34254 RepID=A0AAV3P7E1_LITER
MSSQALWSPLEKKCIFLLQYHKHTRATLLQLQAFMLRNSLETNLNLITTLISTFSSSVPINGIHHSRLIFNQISQKSDTFLCNTLLKSYMNSKEYTECIGLYKWLLTNTEFKPDNYTFSTLVKCCGSNFLTWEGLEVHDHVVKFGFRSNLYVSTSLVDMYGKVGRVEFARMVFDEMTEWSAVSWTALIGGYLRCGDLGMATELFDMVIEKDSASYNVMIDAYVKRGEMELAGSLFSSMPEKNVVSWTSMIDGYCGVGNLVEARLLFDVMPRRNLFSWNAMIGGYSQNNEPHEALSLFDELQRTTMFEPDDITVLSVLPAIADLGALDLGNWVHQYVKKKKFDRSSNVCTAIVDMYAKCGEIVKAREVFEDIGVKETSTWNALINGLAINGFAKEALDIFSEMRSRGFKPNEITMLGVLSACNHGGLVEEGKSWFKAMKELGLTPKIKHYGCLVDLLGRAGCLEEAEKLIEIMPYEANGIILSSFLFACGYFKDVIRAERVINKAIALDPLNDGNYVMLRNLYATERRWGHVEEIKGLMRKKGARKEVGCSVIEINSQVWEFISGDKGHPQWEEIYFKLGNLLQIMKGQNIYTSDPFGFVEAQA